MEYLIRWLNNRINKKNKNNLIVVCGETGSGKSRRALRIAYKLTGSKKILFYEDDRIKHQKNIWLFSKAREFRKLMKNKKPKRGDVIIWDEGGVEANNRNWMTESNKVITSSFQTMRENFNFTLIMTLPSLRFLDAGLRTLFHVYVECITVDEHNDTCLCKIMRIQHNPRLARTYYKYFRVRGEDGRNYIANRTWINNPPQELIEQYEPFKKKYQEELYESDDVKMDELDERKKIKWGQSNDYTAVIEDAGTHIADFILSTPQHGKKISWERIKQHYSISPQGAKIVMKNLQLPIEEPII
jgi:hypothetical protein